MEKSINKVELSGFAGKNPETISTKNGNTMIRFSLATSRSYKGQNDEWMRDTTWHNIIMWDKVAEKGLAEIKKGSFVKLSGKIVNREYSDKNGARHSIVEVRAFEFEVIEVAKKTEVEKAF